LHELSASFVLGYHGCDETVARALLDGASFKYEKNPWDWLGWGVYFWEANPLRALEYALELQSRPRNSAQKISSPAVVGAVIDLGYCLDLMSSTGIRALKPVHDNFLEVCRIAGEVIPANIGGLV
jgi:hypothetical protein